MFARFKTRNTGQACITTTRFYIHQDNIEQFKDTFTQTLADIKVDDGLKEGTDMGPLAQERRLTSMQQFVDDATQKGAKILLGGEGRDDQKRYLYMPSVLIDMVEVVIVLLIEHLDSIT